MQYTFFRRAFSWLLASCGVLALALLPVTPSSALAQTITVDNGGTITVDNGGVWDLNGTTVDLGGTGSTASIIETGGGRFYNGQLTATRTLSAPSQANPAGLGIEVSSGENLGATTITRGHAIQTGNGNQSIERYYDISPGTNSGLGATLTFNYFDAELNGLSESALEFFKSTDSGSTWSEEGQDGRDTNANAVTLSGIESLSRWTLGSVNSPLPVELAAFDGTATEAGVRLTWQTASETNNAGFEVQHKASEGAAWSELGYVESEAEGGTSTESHTYRYRAEDLAVGTHRFRLRQVDIGGAATLSDPIEVRIDMEAPLRLTAPAPNPVRGTATLSFAVKEAAETTLTLYNTLGQEVRTLYRDTPPAGEAQTVRLDATELSSGMYFLRLRADSHVRTQRLTVVR